MPAPTTGGDVLHTRGVPVANTFQGEFPHHNIRLDGYERISPVGAFPAHGVGLVDMIGNVSEGTDSWYGPHAPEAATAASDPGGCCRARLASFDTSSQHGSPPRKVVKGGSFLCAPSYCRRYRLAARMALGIDTSTCPMGCRCVVGGSG
jgi:sulfatase modifying factor 1